MNDSVVRANIQATMRRLAERYGVNEVITDSGLGVYDTVVFDRNRGACYFYSQSFKNTANFEDIGINDLYDCASYLADNLQTAELRDTLDIEKNSGEEELNFVIPAIPVFVNDTMAGELGVVSDASAGDVAQNVVALFNPDGLMSLTVYDENDPEDVELAVAELMALSKVIAELVEKIAERNVMLNGTEEEKRRLLGETDENDDIEEVLDIE